MLKYEPLLREELPSVMRKENVPVVRTALGLIDGYTEAIDIVEPFYLGLLARRRQAQGVADGFCRRIYKDGSPVILGNTVLDKGLLPLQTLCTVTSQTAQDTAHLKATVAHEIEAKTLGRLEEELLRQGTTQTPLVGAHAPGQVAVPPGAMPLITLPQPQHPKPKRRGTPAPPKKKGPPGTSAPKKSKKKGT